jgi:threonine dehydratase
MRRHVRGITTVSEDEIIEAMRLTWEVMKIVIEPSCAVPVAAMLSGRMPLAGKRVGVILTGGNVDLDALPWMRTP